MLREACRRKAKLSQGIGVTIQLKDTQTYWEILLGVDLQMRSGGVRCVLGQAEAGELPAGGGGEEVAVGGADVGGGGDAGASA